MKRLATPLLVVLALGLVAWAGVNLDAYNELQNAAQTRGPVTGADIASVITPLDVLTAGADSTLARPCWSNPTVKVSPRLSDSGATVNVRFILWRRSGTTGSISWEFLDEQVVTATASTTTVDENGLYVAEGILFDTAGAHRYETRQEAPSAGTVTYHSWAFGADSK